MEAFSEDLQQLPFSTSEAPHVRQPWAVRRMQTCRDHMTYFHRYPSGLAQNLLLGFPGLSVCQHDWHEWMCSGLLVVADSASGQTFLYDTQCSPFHHAMEFFFPRLLHCWVSVH